MDRLSAEALDREFVETNSLSGIMGAIGGALLGGALWVGLYRFGIVAALAGIAIIYFSCTGYTVLSKTNTIKGVTISTIIAVVVLVIAQFFCWVLDISYMDRISLLQAIRIAPFVIFSQQYIFGFLKELLIGLLLIGLGSARFMRKTTVKNETT